MRLVVLTAALLALVAAATPGPAAAAAPPSPSTLAKQVVTAKSFRTSSAAVRRVLALGGVTALGRKGRVLVRARAPSARVRAAGAESLRLALDARSRADTRRVSLDRLAAVLKRAGFPLRKGATGGRRLADYLQQRVALARKRPRHALSFTPRFLAAMAARQRPAVNLAKRFDPRALYLSNLEVQLVLADFMRLATPKGRKRKAKRAEAADSGPCAGIAGGLDDLLAPGSGIGRWVMGKGASAFVGWRLTKLMGAGKAKDLTRAMKVARMVLRVQKLAALYSSVSLRVHPMVDEIHKPLARPNQPDEALTYFIAVAGVDPKLYDQYLKQAGEMGDLIIRWAKGCLRQAGIPTLYGPQDIAEEAPKWHLDWKLRINTSDGYVDWRASEFVAPGRFRSKLSPISSYEAAAKLAVRIKPEQRHDAALPVVSVPATATASLDTSQAPKADYWLGVLESSLKRDAVGLSDAVLVALSGFVQSVATPMESAVLPITYHVPCAAGAMRRYPAPVARAAADKCGWPSAWVGNGSGEFVRDGMRVSWTATWNLPMYDQGAEYAGYGLDVAKGTFNWSVAGRNVHNGCAVKGSGTSPAGGDLAVQLFGPPDAYFATLTGGYQTGGYTFSDCPDDHQSAEGDFIADSPVKHPICRPEGSYKAGQSVLAGHRAFSEPYFDQQVPVSCTWSLEAK